MEFIKMYLIAFIVFLIIDGIWLVFVAKNFYSKHLGYIMKEKPNLLAAGLFYLIFIVGVVYFVVKPGVEAQSIGSVILGGALLGFVSYATYDLTNMATVKKWPTIVTVVDLIWGTSLSTVISLVTYLIYNYIF